MAGCVHIACTKAMVHLPKVLSSFDAMSKLGRSIFLGKENKHFVMDTSFRCLVFRKRFKNASVQRLKSYMVEYVAPSAGSAAVRKHSTEMKRRGPSFISGWKMGKRHVGTFYSTSIRASRTASLMRVQTELLDPKVSWKRNWNSREIFQEFGILRRRTRSVLVSDSSQKELLL
jgi:hypothetical protein